MSLRDPFQNGKVVHSSAFRTRRFLNWFPLGLSYAMLYMGRYNLTVAKNELGVLMTKEDFGFIFGAGTITYAIAFLVNGPLTDKIGGKKAMWIALLGSGAANLAMGLTIRSMLGSTDPGEVNLRLIFSGLYAVNMYFQSYGAVAIVKVNSSWFHVRERGGFSGIFGTMISSGIFFAFTVNGWIVDWTKDAAGNGGAPWWVFFAPSIALFVLFVFEFFLLRDHPSEAGHEDIETGDASSGDDDEAPSIWKVLGKVLTNPIILTVALIEFCTGVLRNGVMHWFPIYAKEVWALPSSHYLRRGGWHLETTIPFFVVAAILFFIAYRRREAGQRSAAFWVSAGLISIAPFLQGGWGGLLFVAGVLGGNVAGWVSDIFFNSRRAPAAALLYGLLAVSTIGMFFTLGGATTTVGWVDAEKVPELQVGDTIVSVAGQGDLKEWRDVYKAIACVPATCERGAKWDTERCLCATKPHATEAHTPSDGSLHLVIQRDGKEQALALKDPKPTMHAGDVRTIKAGPKLTMLPLWLGLFVVLMSLGVIGTHGLLSGTATMDFGGKKGAATAVGMIDGFVYAGTALQSVSLGYITSKDWSMWPIFLLPFGLVGLFLLTRIWHAVPSGKKKAAH